MECRSRGCEEEASKEREALVEMKKKGWEESQRG